MAVADYTEVTMTGSGEIGEVQPGWSVGEYATPVAPNVRSNGVGTVSFSADKRDDSLFVINNNSTFTQSNLGSVNGIVKTVNENGPSVSITQTSDLGIFDGEREIPCLINGTVDAALDLLTQVTNKDIRLKSGLTGNFWSLNGHIAGFDSSGNMAEYQEYIVKYTYTGVNGFDADYVVTCKNALLVNTNDQRRMDGKIYNDQVRGDTFITDKDNPNYLIAAKAKIGSTNALNWNVDGWPYDATLKNGSYTEVYINAVAGTLTIYFNRFIGGVWTQSSYPVSINPSIDLTEELALFIEYNIKSAVSPYKYEVKATICSTSDYSIYTTNTVVVDVDNLIMYYSPWVFQQGYWRSVWIKNDTNPVVIEDWEDTNLSYASVAGTYPDMLMYVPPVVGGTYNMWQYLQDACSATGKEIYSSNGIFYIQDIGSNIIDITNIIASPTITPVATLTGESIDIVYTNARGTTDENTIVPYGRYITGRPEVYNAYADDNRIIEVKPGEEITQTVKTDNYLFSVLRPYKDSVFPVVASAYGVCDSTGLNIVDYQWEVYGGDISVKINEDDPTAIDITVIGPNQQIPSTTAPYYLAYSDGTRKYAALSITGAGITLTKETLSLQTGAAIIKTAQDKSSTINNIFITTLEQAYDRGIWASANASGPKVTFNGSMPVSSISGFGLVAGSLFRYSDSIYRIVDATINNAVVTINAERYVTCYDFDLLWSAKTVGYHDQVWAEHDVQDQIIRPLYGVTLTGFYLMFDIDGIVALTDEAYGEATYALDIDGNPYVIATGDDSENALIYLDTDFTPYYV